MYSEKITLKTIQHLFRKYENQEIAEMLNVRGYRTKRGLKWTGSNVSKFVRHKAPVWYEANRKRGYGERKR